VSLPAGAAYPGRPRRFSVVVVVDAACSVCRRGGRPVGWL